jgi:tetratricopeptide (TPR) repeat protein
MLTEGKKLISMHNVHSILIILVVIATCSRLYPGLSMIIINTSNVRLIKGVTSYSREASQYLQSAIAGYELANTSGSLPPEALRLKGIAYIFLGHADLASEQMSLALSRGSPLAAYSLGKLYLAQHQWKLAVAALDKTGCPHYWCVVGRYVEMLLLQGHQLDALNLLEAFVTLHETDVSAQFRLADVYWSMGDKANTILALERALASTPNCDTLQCSYASARVAYLRGDYSSAIVRLETLTRSSPDYWSGWYLLGQVHLAVNEAQQAVPALQKAIELNPSHSWSHYYLASAYTVDDRLADAAAELRRASELSPTTTFFVSALIDIYRRMGESCLEYKTKELSTRLEKGISDLHQAYADIISECEH